MMLDADVVAVSPATVYRVLTAAGVLDRWNGKPSKKGTGFVQPLRAHEHGHIDISYLNVAGTFYYLCSILDGATRFIVHWELRERMTEADVETVLQRARERFPEATPRIISDNGPQFIAKDFKEFVRLAGMTHVRTSPYYPQSNGKTRTLASNAQGHDHPAQGTGLARRGAAIGRGLSRVLQSAALAQCDRLHRAGRHARRPRRSDLGAPRSEARNGPRASASVLAAVARENRLVGCPRIDDRQPTQPTPPVEITQRSAVNTHPPSHISAEPG
jgi:transposase InsO family protein